MNKNNSFSCLPDKKGRYIVLDTETTGVDIKKDYLISLSAVEIIDGKITGLQFNGYIRSRDKQLNKKEEKNRLYFIEDYSKEIFHLEKHTLENFLRFVGDALLFAHNAFFDYKFISNELKKWNMPMIPRERFLCSLSIAKNFVKNGTKNLKKHTVEYLSRHFGFNCNSADFHNAFYDAFMSARIICKIYEIESKIKEEQIQKQILKNQENQVIKNFDMDVCSIYITAPSELDPNNKDSYTSEEEDDIANDPDFTISELVEEFEKVKIEKKKFGCEKESNRKEFYKNDYLMFDNSVYSNRGIKIPKENENTANRDFLRTQNEECNRIKLKNIMKGYINNFKK